MISSIIKNSISRLKESKINKLSVIGEVRETSDLLADQLNPNQ
jgi:hypothetical protein